MDVGACALWMEIHTSISKAHMLIFCQASSTTNKPHLHTYVAVHEMLERRHDAPKKVLTDIRARHNADKRLQLLATSNNQNNYNYVAPADWRADVSELYTLKKLRSFQLSNGLNEGKAESILFSSVIHHPFCLSFHSIFL
uniref:Uncharacterized protein n=1 Tax=Bactrocera dorsalis TaxID=27457 RepID=A0A034WM65_BACDO